MKRLYIIRHAKSSWGNPGQSDFERPLNERGKQNAPLMGKRLKDAGAKPDMIISSPALRAITTARIIAEAVTYPIEKIVQEKRIYEARLSDLVAVVEGINDTYSEVLIFGHNPGFTELAEHLTHEPLGNMPTCAICCVEFDIDSWSEISGGLGKIVSYDYPKNHP